MEEKVEINFENCAKVGWRIHELLRNKEFMIVSFYKNVKGARELPNILQGVSVQQIIFYYDGRLSIPLSPRRRIFWDLNVEKVTVTFVEGGNVIIERVLPKEKSLYRVVVVQ